MPRWWCSYQGNEWNEITTNNQWAHAQIAELHQNLDSRHSVNIFLFLCLEKVANFLACERQISYFKQTSKASFFFSSRKLEFLSTFLVLISYIRCSFWQIELLEYNCNTYLYDWKIFDIFSVCSKWFSLLRFYRNSNIYAGPFEFDFLRIHCTCTAPPTRLQKDDGCSRRIF